jgi:serine/threonine protein kinase
VTCLGPDVRQGGAPNEKSDVWAFGYSLFKCITGRYPDLNKIHNIPNVVPVRFSDRISEAMMMCLEPNAKYRPTAEQVRPIGQ